jgi:hypothetical protein
VGREPEIFDYAHRSDASIHYCSRTVVLVLKSHSKIYETLFIFNKNLPRLAGKLT